MSIKVKIAALFFLLNCGVICAFYYQSPFSEDDAPLASKRTKKLTLIEHLEDLKAITSFPPKINTLVSLYLTPARLMIGCGKLDPEYLAMLCHRPTPVTDNDWCIDINKRVRPDIVGSGFDTLLLRRKFTDAQFDVVKICHVGFVLPISKGSSSCFIESLESDWVTILSHDPTPMTVLRFFPYLYEYIRILKPGGGFRYSSFVYTEERVLFEIAVQKTTGHTLERLLTTCELLLSLVGFHHVKAELQAEPDYRKTAWSLSIQAQKSPSRDDQEDFSCRRKKRKLTSTNFIQLFG